MAGHGPGWPGPLDSRRAAGPSTMITLQSHRRAAGARRRDHLAATASDTRAGVLGLGRLGTGARLAGLVSSEGIPGTARRCRTEDGGAPVPGRAWALGSSAGLQRISSTWACSKTALPPWPSSSSAPEHVGAALEPRRKTRGAGTAWGYRSQVRGRRVQSLPGVLAQALLINRSPRLADLTTGAFTRFARPTPRPSAASTRTTLYRGLQARGCLPRLQRSAGAPRLQPPRARPSRETDPAVGPGGVERWHATLRR